MRKRVGLLAGVTAFVLVAAPAQALSPATDKATLPQEVVDGIAMMPGVERLSYISPRYYGVRPGYDACLAKAQGSVVEKGDCADAEFKFQDERLNKAYKDVISALTASGQKEAASEARAAQRAWLEFFDRDCAVRAGRFGSTQAPATESICRMSSTAIRAQQLEDWRISLGKG
jgi:uncharacterized protein YecT (DUF1311 family)